MIPGQRLVCWHDDGKMLRSLVGYTVGALAQTQVEAGVRSCAGAGELKRHCNPLSKTTTLLVGEEHHSDLLRCFRCTITVLEVTS